ncbi:MAG: pseudouridine synthase [Cytophagales bacterium]|nr:pseudouridine synthase [Cytophagales bacterium]
MLSQFKPETRKKKALLGEMAEFPEGTMAIGRLDADSEGLLLLTTDGKVSERMRRKTVEKEYYVQVDGDATEEHAARLSEGVEIGIKGKKYQTLPCEVSVLNDVPDFPDRERKIRDERHGPTSWMSVTVREGKNRQVRKMTAAVGLPTLRLVRVRVGDVCWSDVGEACVKEVDKLD